MDYSSLTRIVTDMSSPRFLARRYQCISLPPLPPQVDPAHLVRVNQEGRGMLLETAETTQIKTILANAQNGRYGKQSDLPALGLPRRYTIIKIGQDFFALYLGFRKAHGVAKGMQSRVKLVQHLDTGEWIPIKIQRAVRDAFPRMDNAADEKEFASKCSELDELADNEYDLLTLLHMARGKFTRETSQGHYDYAILMNYVQGVPLNQYCNDARLSTVEWLQVVINCINAVKNLHEQYRILHRDIKSENFMIQPATGNVQLLDYSISRRMPAASDQLVSLKKNGEPEVVGTGDKIAYECYEGKYTIKTEVFALGRTIHEILFGNAHPSLFAPASRIADEKIRKAIAYFVRDRLVAVNENYRGMVSDALGFFESLQKEALTNAMLVPIGLLHVADYLALTEAQRKTMIDAMQKVRKVILVDSVHNRPLTEYAQLERSLTQHRITVKQEVHAHTSLTCALITAASLDTNAVNAPIYKHVYLTRVAPPRSSADALGDFNISLLVIDDRERNYFREIHNLINQHDKSSEQRRILCG